MNSQKKIINELRFQLDSKEVKDQHYHVQLSVSDANAILALLKKQEAIPPHYTRLEYLVSGKVVEIYHPECPRCFENGLFLWDAEIEKGQAYCKRCGQAVKWE